jgi:hypothetical protein
VAIWAGVQGYLTYLALRSLREVLPCWWAGLSINPRVPNSCGESIPIAGYNTWVPAAVILGLLALSVLIALSTLASQSVRTALAVRRLGPPVVKPGWLGEMEGSLGLTVRLVNDRRCFCCCVGLVSPRIVLSTQLLETLDPGQVRAVLAHEHEHVTRRDPARATAVRMAANALFYLPLARTLARQSLVAAELGADDSAVRVAGHQALVGALVALLGRGRPALGGATEMASLDSLDVRIGALRTRKLPRMWPSATSIVLSGLALACVGSLSLWLPTPATRIIFHSAVPVAIGAVRAALESA